MGNKYKDKDYQKKYQAKYRELNRDYWSRYFKDVKSNYVYMFLSDTDEILYIGSTNLIANRISVHMRGHSNIELTYAEMQELYGLDRVVYLELDELKRIDSLYIENYLIELHNPILNKNCNTIRDYSKLSISREQLEEIANNVLDCYKEFNIDRYR